MLKQQRLQNTLSWCFFPFPLPDRSLLRFSSQQTCGREERTQKPLSGQSIRAQVWGDLLGNSEVGRWFRATQYEEMLILESEVWLACHSFQLTLENSFFQDQRNKRSSSTVQGLQTRTNRDPTVQEQILIRKVSRWKQCDSQASVLRWSKPKGKPLKEGGFVAGSPPGTIDQPRVFWTRSKPTLPPLPSSPSFLTRRTFMQPIS